jgi:hypothetical protein
MNELEQRLADELDAVATDLGAPLIDVAGLKTAGRRSRVRTRVVPSLAAVAAAAVTAGLVYVLPHHGWSGTDPADPSSVATDGTSDLGRPLELPWWGWDGGSADPDVGSLRVGNQEVPVDGVTAVLDGGGITLVEQDQGTWSVVDQDALRPLTGARLDAPPVVGLGGALAYVVPGDSDGNSLVWEQDGERSELSVAGVQPVVVGVDSGRVLATVGDELQLWKSGGSSLKQVTGLPPEVKAGQIEARPGGVAIREGDTLIAGAIDGTRFRALWETPSHGSGSWSWDGEVYAEAVDGKVRFAMAGDQTVTAADLPRDRTHVIGWESDTEVIVAQWIEADGAVTGLWRCSTTALRCQEIVEPNGKVVLPGLPAG